MNGLGKKFRYCIIELFAPLQSNNYSSMACLGVEIRTRVTRRLDNFKV